MLAVSPSILPIYNKSKWQGLSGPSWLFPETESRQRKGWEPRQAGKKMLLNAARFSRRKPAGFWLKTAQTATGRAKLQSFPLMFTSGALGTALLAAGVLVAVGLWPDWREIPDFGRSGGNKNNMSCSLRGVGGLKSGQIYRSPLAAGGQVIYLPHSGPRAPGGPQIRAGGGASIRCSSAL